MANNTIDLIVIRQILVDAVTTLNSVDGAEWDDKTGKNDTGKALMSKQLNHAADLLQLAASLVRNEYWVGKGFNDPTAVSD